MLVISGINKDGPTLYDSCRRALHIKTILIACILMVLLLYYIHINGPTGVLCLLPEQLIVCKVPLKDCAIFSSG